jgi:hypothetical protein
MNRARKTMERVLLFATFIPLASFKIWASVPRPVASLLTVACIMAAACIGIIILAYRVDKPSYFDWAVGAYFVAAALLLSLMPETGRTIFTRYAVSGIFLSLFLASFLPPVLGMEPFTYHFARKTAPPEVWQAPLFIRINTIMTYAWAGLFASCTLLSLYPSVITRAVIPLSMIVFLGVPFNLKFPDFYLKKKGLPTRREMREMFASDQHKQ